MAASLSGTLETLSLTNSIPMNNPDPLTSPIHRCFFPSSRQESKRYSPTNKACSRRFSFSIVSKTALAIAQDTGLPPYCKKIVRHQMKESFLCK